MLVVHTKKPMETLFLRELSEMVALVRKTADHSYPEMSFNYFMRFGILDRTTNNKSTYHPESLW